MLDFGTGRGLEIGPLDRPLLTRDVADVRYADLYDRDRLAGAHGGTRDTTSIPDIDYPMWDGTRMRSIGEATASGAPFDWIYASHVIEHVPDLVGWLADIESVITPGGALVLVVPDRRYCFDVHRPPTTVGQILQAATDGDTIPSVRAVYDHHRSAVKTPPKRRRGSRLPDYDQRIHDFDEAREQLRRVRAGEYLDCHVWTFTDSGFTEVIDELRALGEIRWRVEAIEPVSDGDLEFFVLMRHDASQIEDPALGLSSPDWLSEVQELRRRTDEQRRVIKAQRAELRALRREVKAVTASIRWRLASRVAAPISAVRRRLR